MSDVGPHGPDFGQEIPEIVWVKPVLEGEFGEYERVATTFYKSRDQTEVIQRIHDAIASANPVEISDEEFENLDNSQAWSEIRPGFLEDTEKVIKKNYEEQGFKKDLPGIIAGFKEGRPMQLPVALKFPDGSNHLISGNTRLLVARAFGIRPKILILDLGLPIDTIDNVSNQETIESE